jgi:hypothetical protein
VINRLIGFFTCDYLRYSSYLRSTAALLRYTIMVGIFNICLLSTRHTFSIYSGSLLATFGIFICKWKLGLYIRYLFGRGKHFRKGYLFLCNLGFGRSIAFIYNIHFFSLEPGWQLCEREPGNDNSTLLLESRSTPMNEMIDAERRKSSFHCFAKLRGKRHVSV